MAHKRSVGLYMLSLPPFTRALQFPTPLAAATAAAAAAAHDALQPNLPEATPAVDDSAGELRRRTGYDDTYGASATYTSWTSASVCGFVDGVLDFCTCSVTTDLARTPIKSRSCSLEASLPRRHGTSGAQAMCRC